MIVHLKKRQFFLLVQCRCGQLLPKFGVNQNLWKNFLFVGKFLSKNAKCGTYTPPLFNWEARLKFWAPIIFLSEKLQLSVKILWKFFTKFVRKLPLTVPSTFKIYVIAGKWYFFDPSWVAICSSLPESVALISDWSSVCLLVQSTPAASARVVGWSGGWYLDDSYTVSSEINKTKKYCSST